MVDTLTERQRKLLQDLIATGIEREKLTESANYLFDIKSNKPVDDGQVLSQCKTTSDKVFKVQKNDDSVRMNIYDNSETTNNEHSNIFVEKLLRCDPWIAAQQVKEFMMKHNIPQREVVDSTGLNQSHLSQYINKGTPMKPHKRKIIYQWMQDKQKNLNIEKTVEKSDNSACAADTSSMMKRNRFKWGASSLKLLQTSFEKNRNPSKTERDNLVDGCNRVECQRRGLKDTNITILGDNTVTHARVYNWFANQRKEDTSKRRSASSSNKGDRGPSIQTRSANFQNAQSKHEYHRHHPYQMTKCTVPVDHVTMSSGHSHLLGLHRPYISDAPSHALGRVHEPDMTLSSNHWTNLSPSFDPNVNYDLQL